MHQSQCEDCSSSALATPLTAQLDIASAPAHPLRPEVCREGISTWKVCRLGESLISCGASPYDNARSGATNTTAPVGRPVGDPPAGSMLTATWVELAKARCCSWLKSRRNTPLLGRTPSDTGAPPAGSAHSS